MDAPGAKEIFRLSFRDHAAKVPAMDKLRAAFLGLPWLCAAFLIPCTSYADEAGPEEKARLLLEQGKTAREAKDYGTALRLFREAHDSHETVSLDALVNMADCEAALGQTAQAYLHYTEFLRRVKGSHERVADVTAIVASMMKTGPWIRFVRRDVLEANSVVLIDGVALGPITAKAEDITAEPGEHTIVITEPSKGDRKITAKVEPGKRYVVDFRPKGPPTGIIGPQTGNPSTSGTVPHWLLPSGIMLTGTGALTTLMMGALFANGAASDRHALEADCAKDDGNGNTCDPAKVPDLEPRRAAADGMMNTATGLFVAGGVLTTAAVVLIVVNRSKASNTAFAPLVLPGGGGLSMTGRF